MTSDSIPSIPSSPVTHVEREIAAQPSAWRAALARLDEYRPALPPRGARVAAVGCGTSLYMCRAYAARRELLGAGETDAVAASDFRYNRRYDHVVALSRSGTTTEVLDVLGRLDPAIPTTVLTVDPESEAGRLGRHVIALPMAAERSVVQTVFPTTALAVLRADLGDDLSALPDAAEAALAGPVPVGPPAHHQFTFVGLDWAAGIADEAALKCREAAGAWTESYPAMEYRHGPISVSGPGTVVWVFGAVPTGLAAAVEATGATLVTSDLDPMVDLVRAQRLAVALAAANGRDPDHPQALTFSVVLDQ